MKTAATLVALVLAAVGTAHASWTKGASELDPSNFDEKVINSKTPWLVAFYAPWCGHCKNLAPAWGKAAAATEGIVGFGAVNADAHNELGTKYGVDGFPTIKTFGNDKSKPVDYNGGRDVQALINGALKLAQDTITARVGGGSSGGSGGGGGSGSSKVVELTESSFEKEVLGSEDLWIVAFTAPWCGHCKNLVPQFATASVDAAGKAKFGNVDSTVHQGLAGRFGVKGYPTIKVFAGGKKDGKAEDYQGGRTASDLVQWAEEEALKNMPPPEVKELLGPDGFDSDCKAKQICFMAFLPPLEQACKADREQFIKFLQNSAERYKRNPFGWTWSVATSQGQAEQAFDVVDYPALVAVNSKKSKFALMRGTFSEDGISSFVNKLQAGRQSTVSLDALPTIATAEAWDGSDYVPEVFEEEFDLSDLMDDDEDDEAPKDEL
jgi:protein disulfide-isomerase A6